MFRVKSEWVSVNWFYAVVGLVGLLLILLSRYVPVDWPTLAVLLKEAGFAALIATILIFTVERITRERHERAAGELVERINTDLFRAIYHRYIPGPVFAEVEKCLLRSNVLRENYNVDYTLDYLDETIAVSEEARNDHLRCSIFTKYRLVNLSDSVVKHPVELHLERPLTDELLPYAKIREVHIDGERLSADCVSEASAWGPTHLVFRHEITIEPRATVDVSMTSQTIRRKLDVEVWVPRVPSSGLTLRVNAPSKISVQATANHFEALKRVEIDSDKTHIWELNHGIFPFQSVSFWWKAE